MAHVIEVHEQMNTEQRCDRCGAQAFVEVALENGNGSLLFCGHHYKVHGDVFAARPGVMVADHRAALRNAETGTPTVTR